MRRRSTLGVLSIVALAAGMAWLQQVPDYNQNSHYALVRALASGTPKVDRTLGEIGELDGAGALQLCRCEQRTTGFAQCARDVCAAGVDVEVGD